MTLVVHGVTPLAINALAWESDFFSQRIGKVDLTQLHRLTPTECQAWDLVQAKIPSGDYQTLDTLSSLGFVLAEGESQLEMAVESSTRQPGIRIARPTHIPLLRELASKMFTESRFRAPWFEQSLTEQFYAQWIENAVLGTFDHQCLLSLDDRGTIAGFVSLREADSTAHIGLLGVARSHRGAGVGRQLLLAAADWTRTKGLTQLHIATQLSNVAALRLYLRHGARLTTTSYWLYRKSNDSI
nr:dTDP-4-amino-4,6-dideoxy-D-galactose acyltransferase [Rosenbergiella australiborealis]